MQYGLTEGELSALTTLFAKYTTIEQVILYGSRAKGNFRANSDIDITLVGENVDRSTLNSLYTEIDDLLLAYQFDISIFHQLSNPDLVEAIEKTGKLIYEGVNSKKN